MSSICAADASAGIGIPIDITQAVEAARVTQAFIEHSREQLRRDPRLLAAIVDDMAGKLLPHRVRRRERRLLVQRRGLKRPAYRERGKLPRPRPAPRQPMRSDPADSANSDGGSNDPPPARFDQRPSFVGSVS